jgi:hypothetical protein
MPAIHATAGAPAHRAAALLLLALLAASGCQWYGWIPGERRVKSAPSPGDFVPLHAGLPRQAALDCPAGSCQTRYRIHVQDPGELRLDVVPSLPGDDVGLRVVLQDSAGNVLAQERATGEASFQVKSEVEPGPHVVLVQAIGGRVSYELTATVRRDARRLAQALMSPVPPTPEALPSSPPAPTDRVGDKTATLDSDSAYDPGVDFSLYRRFAFSQQPEEKLEGPPGSSTGNPFLEAQIQREIRFELLRRGFSQAEEETEADFLVSSHVGARSTTWYSVGATPYSRSYDQWFDRWASHGAHIRPHTYRNGTLVIDIVDMRTKELTWHGWTTQPAPPAADAKELIRKVVAEVLDEFPPR